MAKTETKIALDPKAGAVNATIVLDPVGRPSSSGKTNILFTTGGYQTLSEDENGRTQISVTVIRNPKKAKA